MMDNLCLALKKMVIEECRVSGVTADQIPSTDPVIGSMGLVQLDSLDAVEIVTTIERTFKINAESMPLKNIFRSYNELTDYVEKHAPKDCVDAFLLKYI